MIETICGGCRQKLQVADEYRGRQARCPACGWTYTIGSGTSENLAGYPFVSSANQPVVPNPSPADGSQRLYFAKTPDGTIYGPVDRDALQRWIREGRLNETCQFREGESSPWQSLALWSSLHPTQVAGSPLLRSEPSDESIRTGNPSSDVNPYAAAPVAAAPYNATYPGGPVDRSGVILTMGILSWAVSFISCGCMGWIPAIIGIVMAQQDLAAIQSGALAPHSKGTIQVGFWLSVIHLIMVGLGAIGYFGLMILANM